ncbi:MAG: adenylate/guanylate cyclase domain-containing protein [Deltaproteobacteria bacterium]|nr:adenylate/guanylate cyclase domain-containing protein [Deltaproteobacteria bacterium]
MEEGTETRTVLFADIAKSSHLYEVLGDGDAQRLITEIIEKLSSIAKANAGEVIKTIGDEVMCTFPTADRAVVAATAMHEAMTDFVPSCAPKGFTSPNLYVGMHHGRVIRESGDVFGDAVNVASRMVSMAKPRQILTTEQTVSRLSPEHQDYAECVDKTVLKGKSGTVEIYEIIWERQDLTVMVDSLMDSQVLRFRLELTFGDQRLELDQTSPSATLGRQTHNDLVVEDSRVSRTHCRVEYRRGSFVLTDVSSNGTYVVDGQGKAVKLRREEIMLVGKGTIYLGRKPESNPEDAIQYEIHN